MSVPIDLTQLPAPQVVEVLSFESIFARRKASTLALVAAGDREEFAATLELESEPATKLLQENAYQEMIVRNRINDAAKATMLAYAVRSDLDQIGANKEVKRLTIVPANKDAAKPTEAVMEEDDVYRLRIQEAPNGLSVAGPGAAYEFHARSADGRVKDASATSPAPCEIVITVLSTTKDGIAPPDLLKVVDAAVNPEEIRPLGDMVTVQSAQIIDYEINGTIYICNAPESAIIQRFALARLTELSIPKRPLGHSIYRSACNAAMHVQGVTKVDVNSPPKDIVLNKLQAARCTAIRLNVVVLDD
jgi:phage-related baseplate assembly protein